MSGGKIVVFPGEVGMSNAERRMIWESGREARGLGMPPQPPQANALSDEGRATWQVGYETMQDILIRAATLYGSRGADVHFWAGARDALVETAAAWDALIKVQLDGDNEDED